MKLRLEGKTKHGKNRVREQGSWWVVLQTAAMISCDRGGPGPFALLKAESGHPDGLRWISMTADKDFTVAETIS